MHVVRLQLSAVGSSVILLPNPQVPKSQASPVSRPGGSIHRARSEAVDPVRGLLFVVGEARKIYPAAKGKISITSSAQNHFR